MNKCKTIDELWEDLKLDNEDSKLTIETSRKVIDIIRTITKTRQKLNISQRELAEKCGIKQPALARIEAFKTIPQINTLIKIAECVNLSVVVLNEEQKLNITIAEKIASIVTNLTYNTECNRGNSYGYFTY